MPVFFPRSEPVAVVVAFALSSPVFAHDRESPSEAIDQANRSIVNANEERFPLLVMRRSRVRLPQAARVEMGPDQGIP
jgi:hypothetical protein